MSASADDLGRPSGDAARVRLALADDHEVVRSGLRLVLAAQPDIEIVAEASDLAETSRMVLGYKPDVLVLDLNMPDGSSLETIPQMLASSPGTTIVVLTMQEDPAFAREALRAGARGYVLKEAANAELVHAIRTALDGRTYLHPTLGAQIAAAPERAELPDDLSPRELEVLRLIALGHTNSEVAQTLYLSVRTVETHRAHVQRKLGRVTRAELVDYALQRELIGPRTADRDR